MLSISRRVKIVLAFSFIIIALYFLRPWIFSKGNVPASFKEARLQGAVISENIVNLSNQSSDDIKKINELDQEKKFSEALNLTLKAINQSQEIRSRAVDLSNELSKMTQGLSDINSLEARQAAIEAISSDLALLSRLVNYSAYLNDLLAALQSKFSGASGDHKVSGIVNEINSEVNAINNFNRQAIQALDNFDKIVNGNK